MALVVAPSTIGLPSLEPMRLGLLQAMRDDLPEALEVVEQRYLDPPMTLPPPAEYSSEVVRSYAQVTAWPLLCVYSGPAQSTTGWQGLPGGKWEGQLIVRLFVQNSDPDALTASLERYGAALWLVMVNADQANLLAGAQMLAGSEEIQPDPGGGTLTARALEVRMNVSFTV